MVADVAPLLDDADLVAVSERSAVSGRECCTTSR